LWRGVEEPVPRVAEGTSAVLILPMLFGVFRPPKPDRKSGVAQWRDLRFLFRFSRRLFSP
jgi:hypothetical protein